jgi:hypothetical protein
MSDGLKVGIEQPVPLTQTDFTRELTDLCRKHGVGIEGGHVWEMDSKDTGPDADINPEYAINEEGYLVRTF